MNYSSTVIEPKPCWHGVWTGAFCVACKLEADLAAMKLERDAALVDAGRYRWLRDVSVPPHNFYLSVPVEFADTRYEKHEVDAAIDAAIAAQKEV